jgi:hypothetical protein
MKRGGTISVIAMMTMALEFARIDQALFANPCFPSARNCTGVVVVVVVEASSLDDQQQQEGHHRR